jgi:hypothetical protein
MSLEFKCSQEIGNVKLDPKKAENADGQKRLEITSKILNGYKAAYFRDPDTYRNLVVRTEDKEILVIENTSQTKLQKLWVYSSETGEYLRSNEGDLSNSPSYTDSLISPSPGEGDLILKEINNTGKSCIAQSTSPLTNPQSLEDSKNTKVANRKRVTLSLEVADSIYVVRGGEVMDVAGTIVDMAVSTIYLSKGRDVAEIRKVYKDVQKTLPDVIKQYPGEAWFAKEILLKNPDYTKIDDTSEAAAKLISDLLQKVKLSTQ